MQNVKDPAHEPLNELGLKEFQNEAHMQALVRRLRERILCLEIIDSLVFFGKEENLKEKAARVPPFLPGSGFSL